MGGRPGARPAHRWGGVAVMTMKKVKVDSEKCQGHNRCYAMAPGMFKVDELRLRDAARRRCVEGRGCDRAGAAGGGELPGAGDLHHGRVVLRTTTAMEEAVPILCRLLFVWC